MKSEYKKETINDITTIINKCIVNTRFLNNAKIRYLINIHIYHGCKIRTFILLITLADALWLEINQRRIEIAIGHGLVKYSHVMFNSIL